MASTPNFTARRSGAYAQGFDAGVGASEPVDSASKPDRDMNRMIQEAARHVLLAAVEGEAHEFIQSLVAGKTADVAASGPRVTVVPREEPSPEPPGASCNPPAAMMAPPPPWPRSFREALCEKMGIGPKDFEREVLWRALPPRSVPMAFLLHWVNRKAFKVDKEIVRNLGDTHNRIEFKRELQALIAYNQSERPFLRNLLGLRVSAKRLIQLQSMAFHQDQPEHSGAGRRGGAAKTAPGRAAPATSPGVTLCAPRPPVVAVADGV